MMTVATLEIARSEREREEQAAALPRQLMHYLTEGDDGPGLTLTRAHMATLDGYTADINTIPTAREPLVAWLGYSAHADAELAVDAMQQLFTALHTHAAQWPVLRARCMALPTDLGACARAVEHSGNQVLAACERTEALGSKRDAWQSVQFQAPVTLSLEDCAIVADLSSWLGIIRHETRQFHAQVTALCARIEVFRDTARFDYRPRVWRKIDAISRTQDHPGILRLRLALERLDVRIETLEQIHANVLAEQASTALFALEFRHVLHRVRADADDLRQLRINLSADLTLLCRSEGRLQGLSTRLDQLITRMQDVTTSASHLQTAWQLIDVYIESSIERLQKMQNSQQLGRFIIHFESFLAQWAFIEQCAMALEKRLQ